MAARFGRAFGLFVPWQEIDLEWARIGRPRLPATIGLFSYYLIAVTALGGVVVLRRRKVTLFPAAIILAEVALVAVAIFGQTRYRTPLDVILVVLAGVALDHVATQRSKGPGRHAIGSPRAIPPLVDAGDPPYVAPGIAPEIEYEPEPEVEYAEHDPPPETGGISAAPDSVVDQSDSFWSRPQRSLSTAAPDSMSSSRCGASGGASSRCKGSMPGTGAPDGRGMCSIERPIGRMLVGITAAPDRGHRPTEMTLIGPRPSCTPGTVRWPRPS